MKMIATDYNSADIMRIMREWTGLEQADFGKTIKKSERTVRAYEAGDINVTVNMLLDIARKNGIEIIIRKK